MKIQAVIAVALIAASTAALAAEPSLVGTWVGERERIAANEDACPAVPTGAPR